VLHLTGHPLLQSTDGGAAFARLIARAKDAGLVVSVDPGSAGFLADFGAERFLAAVQGVDVLLPSFDEATLLTGLDDPLAVVEALPFDTVVAKLGRDGAIVRSGPVTERVPAETVDIVDPTGAGDAFAAGFLAAWAAGGDPIAATRAAVAVGARAVAVRGGRPQN
jgi:sugar/nucleoside kinase (ribokinase family)